MKRCQVAVVQMTSTPDVGANLATVERWVRRAADRGAGTVLVPENFAFIGDGTPVADAVRLRISETIGEDVAFGPIVERMSKLAMETRTHLILGAMPEKARKDPARAFNSTVVLGPDGRLLGRYRKIHLFDVTFGDAGPGEVREGRPRRHLPSIRESKSIAPGGEPALLELPDFVAGLTICYDLRFPELFRRLALDGAEVFTVPAAFTLHTGKDHWEVLLRARAIENTSYVLAAAQWGANAPGRVTWGKSMIVDPWGQILASCSEGEGIAVAELDPDLLARIRASLPTLAHVSPTLVTRPPDPSA